MGTKFFKSVKKMYDDSSLRINQTIIKVINMNQHLYCKSFEIIQLFCAVIFFTHFSIHCNLITESDS